MAWRYLYPYVAKAKYHSECYCVQGYLFDRPFCRPSTAVKYLRDEGLIDSRTCEIMQCQVSGFTDLGPVARSFVYELAGFPDVLGFPDAPTSMKRELVRIQYEHLKRHHVLGTP